MIKYFCDGGCGKELKVMFNGRMEPIQYTIGFKHPDGSLIMAKITSMDKPPNKMDEETKEVFSDPVKHICTGCLAKKVQESEVAVII